MQKPIRSIFIATLVFFLVNISDAHAYIDPGTGSMILQTLIAAALGTLLAVKLFWHRLKSFLRTVLGRNGQQEVDDKS